MCFLKKWRYEKKIILIMVICNEDKISLCFLFKMKVIKVISIIKKIPFNIKQNNININLIGDKGYIINWKFKIFNKEVKIITSLRKNNKKNHWMIIKFHY